MKKISEMCKMLIKIAAAGMISLVILSGFCLLYSFSGVHISNPSGSTDYKWEPGQWKATMTEGLSFNQYLVASEKIKEKGLDFFQLVYRKLIS